MPSLKITVALLLAFPAAHAQRTIRILSQGQPVANAEVSVVADSGRVALARTDGDGIVALTPRNVSARDVVLVRRLGFAPVRALLGSSDTLTITLVASPATLPVVAVATKVLTCPAADDAVADSIWRTAARKYQTTTTGVGLRYQGGKVEETVSAEQRGYGDGTPIPLNLSGGRNFGPNPILMNDPPPYALYERHTGLAGEYWRWRYAPLQELGGHFTSVAFRAGHTLHVLGGAGDEIVLGFCPMQKREADIQGELVMSSTGELRTARWFVRQAHDDEGAGGEATFVSTHFENSAILVAVRGATWRRATKDLYNQERFEKVSWSLRRIEGK